MNKIACVALSTLLGSAGIAAAATSSDQTFMTKAIQGDMAEVQMGQLAQQKGGNQDVKSFGQMLVNDHQANEQKADKVASQIGVTPPASPSAKQQAAYQRLSKLSGAVFDRAFARAMVTDHKKNIAQFRREARGGHNAVAQYAAQTLPTLRKHLRVAEQIEHDGGRKR